MRKNKIIVFLGTDGSGKSTIINAVTPIIEKEYNKKIHYEHLRPNYIPSLAVLLGKRTKEQEAKIERVENPHAKKPSGFLGSLFRLSYYIIDYTVGYLLKVYPSKDIFFFDRYYYDYLIDAQRNLVNLPLWIIKFYGFFIPSPDLIICLGTDAEKIYQRKPELPLEEVVRQINELKKISVKYKSAVWIDTGCSIEETIENTVQVIDNCLDKNA
jgi:thymidylate kinase